MDKGKLLLAIVGECLPLFIGIVGERFGRVTTRENHMEMHVFAPVQASGAVNAAPVLRMLLQGSSSHNGPRVTHCWNLIPPFS